MHNGDTQDAGLESFEHHNGRTCLPVEFDEEDNCHPVAITHFDFTGLDTLAGEAKEALTHGRFDEFVETLHRQMIHEVRKEVLIQLWGFASKFDNPFMGIDVARFISGTSNLEGETIVTLAKKWGVSKEDIQQHCERGRKLLGMRKTRTMRDEKARTNMRMRNYRRA